MHRSAQGSVEYLILLGATILIIFLVIWYIATSPNSAAKNQAEVNNNGISSVMSHIKDIASGEVNK